MSSDKYLIVIVIIFVILLVIFPIIIVAIDVNDYWDSNQNVYDKNIVTF